MQSKLTRQDLDQLTLRWEQWEAEATTNSRRIVRARLHLLFLLIRAIRKRRKKRASRRTNTPKITRRYLK